MNALIENYNLLVSKYQKIERDTREKTIHDKRVILRRIFPMLSVFKLSSSDLKHGEKSFKQFGKLRDTQVLIAKLQSIDQTPELIEYVAFLKKRELKLQKNTGQFCKKNRLIFPSIPKKTKVETSKITSNTDKLLNKLIGKLALRCVGDVNQIHKIRIAFKKYRYGVETLSIVETIGKTNLEKLKTIQDNLGEIHDLSLLIDGLKTFYCRNKLYSDGVIESFEAAQKGLIEKFDNEIESLITICRHAMTIENIALD